MVYGVRVKGVKPSSRRVGGRMNVRMRLSALEVRRVVPSAVLVGISACGYGNELN